MRKTDNRRYLLRRAAVRSFSASPLKARTIVTKTPSGLRQTQKWQMPVFQRRFASEDASPAQEKTSGETVTTEPTETEQAMKEEASQSGKQGEAVTTEAQAEQEPNVVEKSVPGAAEQQPQSTMDQVNEKVKDAAASARSAAESLLGESARDEARGTYSDPKPSRILYVGNLFFEVKAQDLEREFSSYGKIINARVAEDAKGLSRGYLLLLQMTRMRQN